MGGWPGRGRGHAGRDQAANGAHGLLAWISHTSGIATTGLFAGSRQLQAPHRPWHLYPPTPPCGQIGETIEFDRAIQVGIDWARTNPETLIIVTADHGHTSQIIDPQTASDHSPGAIATLITADGQPMVVNYATNLDGRSQSHTGTEVRIAAQGPQGANVVGVTNQTDLFHTMARALGLE